MSGISGARTLHRLIYASQSRLETADTDQTVEEIIRISAHNNRKAGVTGLLLVHDGWFVQALEGAAEAVMTTYGRILRAPRHSEAVVLSAAPTETRSFAEWDMCARRLGPADDAILDTLSQRGRFEPHRLNGEAALRLLTAVRGIQNRNRAS